MKIGKVVRRTGLSAATIRYYERLGLVPEVPRSRSGFREFDGTAIRRLRFVRRARSLGFTLEEVGELLELRIDDGATTADVRERATEKLEEIEGKIADLDRVGNSLRELTETCCSDAPTSECPILEALEDVGDGTG